MAVLVRVRPAVELIAWGPTIAGVFAALALTALFAVLGVAIGATLFNPFSQNSGLSIGGGLWTVFSALVALQVGGFIATRASPQNDEHLGILQGAVVWAVYVVAALLLGGLGATLGASALLHPDALLDARLATAEDPAEAEAIADATATLAWWGFTSLAMGLAGAVAGGVLGEEPGFWETWPRSFTMRATDTTQPPVPPT